jgi:hypothetical protein
LVSHTSTPLRVSEVEVAQDIVSWFGSHLPGFPAIDSLQQSTFAAGNPTPILIKKKDRVQPGKCAGRLSRPVILCQSRKREAEKQAEGGRQKAAGSRQWTGDTEHFPFVICHWPFSFSAFFSSWFHPAGSPKNEKWWE